MAGMHHALILASRIGAGVVAAMAFYFAFFLYENEEGIWQNRIENLWASVYDRAKITDSTSTALFNKIGEMLRNLFVRIYGKKMLSIQAVAVSTDLSLGGAILFAVLTGVWSFLKGNQPDVPNPGLGIVVATSLLFCALLPHVFRKPWTIPAACLPIVGFLIAFLVTGAHGGLAPGMFYSTIPVVWFLSIMSDFLAVIVLRKMFASITRNISIAHLLLLIVALIGVSLAIAMSPVLVVFPIRNLVWTSDAAEIAQLLFLLNVTTLLFCILPLAMLFVVLVHRLTWPTLSRLLYPVASRKIITNRPALVSSGSVCFLYAVTAQVGIEKVLKVLS
jgi:hypothetical protein